MSLRQASAEYLLRRKEEKKRKKEQINRIKNQLPTK
ncbi:MAG: hypothetical protein ACI9VT_003695 [Psychroserpens sp.]|jgi:hypothetical protein